MVPLAHAVGWSRARRLLVALSVVVLAAWLTDRGLVRWIAFTAEVAGQVDNTVADLRLRVPDPPQLGLEGAQSRLVMAWDAADPACTAQAVATLRWVAGLTGDREGQVGLMLLPTAEDEVGKPLGTAVAAVHNQEKLLSWLQNSAGEQPVTVEALRQVVVSDEREGAIFARQLDNTELQLAAHTWARMAQGLELGRCGARLDGWKVQPKPGESWTAALQQKHAQVAALHGATALEPELSQQAAVRTAGLSAATAARWQRWIIAHQKVGDRLNEQGNGRGHGQ